MENSSEIKEFETIIYEKKGKVASITLNRPEKHNALSYQLLDDLDASLDYAEADESTSVPGDKLEEEVNTLASEIAAIPRDGALHNKIAMNMDLRILGVDALFDYYGQMNRYTRFINKE